MPRRGENIYKRKDGRWEGRILDPEGTYKYVYAKTYKEVKEKQRKFKMNMKPQEARISGPAKTQRTCLNVGCKGMSLRKVKPSTYGNYFCCMQYCYVIPFFKRPENKSLTEMTAIAFTNAIKENEEIAESYKRKILTIFRTSLKEIMKDSSAYASVMNAVSLPKTDSAEVHAFSVNEQRLIEYTALHAKDTRALGIILTFYTGIRLGELCALKWGDFDCEASVLSVSRTVTRVKNMQNGDSKTTLHVGGPKSRKSLRKIPLPKFIQGIVNDYRKFCTNDDNYLISGSETPTDPRAFQRLYKKILSEAGVPDPQISYDPAYLLQQGLWSLASM